MSRSFLNSIFGASIDPELDMRDVDTVTDAMGAVNIRRIMSPTDCDDCGIPMIIDEYCYICNKCGSVKHGADQLARNAPTSASAVVLMSGNGKLQTFNASGVATEKTRADSIEAALLRNQRDYAAKNDGRIAFPHPILSAVATRFADIQRDHLAAGFGPFIHRGDVRKCFIATLIRDECGNQQYPTKPDTIAEFMQLSTAGFSDGETIMQDLVEKKLTTMYDSCPLIKYIERYLEFLNLRERDYENFVLEIVERSEAVALCMSSHIYSKIAGAVMLLVICLQRRDITPNQIEEATNNTKVNTFKKFYVAVMENISLFVEIFETNGVPFPTLTQPKKPTRAAMIRRIIKANNEKIEEVKRADENMLCV